MSFRLSSLILPLLAFAAAPLQAAAPAGWWNPAWAHRQPFVIDASANAGMNDGTGPVTVLLRMRDGVFNFDQSMSDGSDLRFASEDGKTQYPSQIEYWNGEMHEGQVWVKLPAIQPGSKTTIMAYYGNGSPTAANKPAEAYDADSSLVWHFNGSGAPVDSTANANEAVGNANIATGSFIAGGLRLLGTEPLTIKENPSLIWTGAMTISMWLRPNTVTDNNVLLSRGEGAQSFRILLEHGVPIIEIGGIRSSGGAPLAAQTWAHLAVTAEAGTVKIYVDGKLHSTAQSALPGLNGPITLGGPAGAGATAFSGELDELEIAKVARSAGWVSFQANSQGSGEASSPKLIVSGAAEEGAGNAKGGGESELMQQIGLFGDIAHNMKFDGWIAIALCVVMIATGWTVAFRKFFYLNSIQKGTDQFLRQWKTLSADVTALDHSDADSVRSFGGNADPRAQRLVEKSPLYEIYHIGSEEIRHRLDRDKERTQGLSGRSIQAIRAALDGGMVHATHKLTNGLVFLTISIAGGPYVGLLGTVVGVMVTFAIIAKNGEVDVNSIAPGIASALLATVAGLVVAIPALFMYSYLNSRIKVATSSMQVFIDEFVSKMAEFYPPAGEVSPYAPAPSDKAA